MHYVEGEPYYLEQVCGDPYNLEPPPHAVDYLLRNGRAVVLLDGLDKLVEPELRRGILAELEDDPGRPVRPAVVRAGREHRRG